MFGILKRLNSVKWFVLFTAVAIYASTSHAALLKPGQTVLMGRGDTKFVICNRTKDTLQIALIYKHVWKFGKPATWPVKGWFVYSPGECSDVAVNGLFGIMSVTTMREDGELKPYYSGTASVDETSVYNSEAKAFDPIYLCVGEAPFDGYRKEITEFSDCEDDQPRVPFSIMFKQGGNESFTLDLN